MKSQLQPPQKTYQPCFWEITLRLWQRVTLRKVKN